MKHLLGIGYEHFEYNKKWKSSVLFLFFFLVSSLTFKLMIIPNIDLKLEKPNKTIEVISKHLNISPDNQKKAQSLVNKYSSIKNKYKGKKSDKTSHQSEITEAINKNSPKPTTIDTLNED